MKDTELEMKGAALTGPVPPLVTLRVMKDTELEMKGVALTGPVPPLVTLRASEPGRCRSGHAGCARMV